MVGFGPVEKGNYLSPKKFKGIAGDWESLIELLQTRHCI